MLPRQIARYGYRRDKLDVRDVPYAVAEHPLPPVCDLRAKCPPHMDQGQLGSCTAHGITGALRYAMIAAGHPDLPLSRLQLYYDERVVEGTVDSDAGAEIRDGVKCAGSVGVANELLWPYHVERFRQKPSSNVYRGALKFEALEYQRVGDARTGLATATMIKTAISQGYPVIGGFNVFSQFESDECAATGVVTMPAAGEASIGGHCTYFPAYGVRPGCVTGRNSYGADWGDGGDFHVPEQYLEEQGSDFWIIKKVGVRPLVG